MCVINHWEIKVYMVYGVDNLHTGFDKSLLGVSDSHIMVFVSNVLKAILCIILYRNQLN